MRLGKKAYSADARTLMLGNFISPTVVVPSRYDFDKGRSAFPFKSWGNDRWGDCVMAGRANHLLRFERLEQRRTISFTDEDVVNEYKRLVAEETGTPPASPGDTNDNGLVVLNALKSWRNDGWKIRGARKRGLDCYTISAYGELQPNDNDQIRQAIFLFHGVQLGFWLPKAVQGASEWSYNGQSGPEWRPGSWGGHLVYAKAYSPDEIEVISWGRRIKVDNNFIAKYCDEAWACVDNLDYWKKRPEFDVDALIQQLKEIGARGVG